MNLISILIDKNLRQYFAVLFFMVVFFGCGSGSSDNNESKTALSQDSCAVLGLGRSLITGKIIDGTACQSNSSPVVKYQIITADKRIANCSGTMITPTDLLTAGHCFDNSQPVVSIVASINGVDVAATSYAVHPGFVQRSADLPGGEAIFNDVAIVRLPFEVPLPTLPIIGSGRLAKDDIISIFGYGLDRSGNFGTLSSGEMRVEQVTSNHIVSLFDDEGSNTCQGDSGGPAIITLSGTPAVVGLTSSGVSNAKCLKGDVSLFANLSDPEILDFITTASPGVQVL
jgi:secreted trypsin-like serine protease